MWITSMGNHGAAGGISERRLSSCSSISVKWVFSLHEIIAVADVMVKQKTKLTQGMLHVANFMKSRTGKF